jgi:tetratricopeptide (TPR) repeat protein
MEATEQDFWQEVDNDKSYDRLTMAIRFSDTDRLNIFIAVCDQPTIQEEVIDRYTAELQSGFHCHQLTVSSNDISTKKLLYELIDREPIILQPYNKTVVSITGAADLPASSNSATLQKRYGREDITRTDQEMFFSSLQWTREGLREFHFPIIIWVTKALYDRMVQEAPDFWSWRKGVFFFKSNAANTKHNFSQMNQVVSIGVCNNGDVITGDIIYIATHGSDNSISQYINAAENSAESQSRQSEILAELQELITKLIAQDPHHRGLAILYGDVADIYAAMGDRAQSIIYRQKSLEIRENIGKQYDTPAPSIGEKVIMQVRDRKYYKSE